MKRILDITIFCIFFLSLSSGCTSIVLIDPLDKDSNDPAIEELESLSTEIPATLMTADSTLKVKEIVFGQGKVNFKRYDNEEVDSIDINRVKQIEFLDRLQGINTAYKYIGWPVFVLSSTAVYMDDGILGHNIPMALVLGGVNAIFIAPIPVTIGAVKGKKIIYINRSNQSDSTTTKTNNMLNNNALGRHF